VLSDMKHLFGPGVPGPAPDISIVCGAREPDAGKLSSFDVTKQGVIPCLVIEVVSPFDARIRRTDEVDKMALYQRRATREKQERIAAEERAAREAQERRAAEERAVREEAARKVAEAELERLRAEIERLQKER
jgi:hypothetical protein